MPKIRSWKGLLVASAAMSLLLTACASGDPAPSGSHSAPPSGTASLAGEVEVGVLAAEGTSDFDFMVGVGDSITAQYPGASFRYTFANTKVRPMMEQRWRAGDAPDLDYFVFNAQVPNTWEFTDKLVDLTPYLAEQIPSGGTWGDSFFEATKSVTQLDGATYGVVTDTHVITLFYNKKIFDSLNLKAPTTWDEFVKVGYALKAAGIAPIAVTGMYEPYMGHWVDNLFQREVGYEKARAAAFSGDYSDQGYLEAAKKLQEIRDAGFFIDGFQGTDFTATQMEFFQGKAGMILMGTWLSSEMKDSIPADFQLGVIGFPKVPGAKGDQDAQLGHSNIMVLNKNSKNIELALEYMRTLTSPEAQTQRSQEVSSISAVKGVPAPAGVEGLEEVLNSAQMLNVRHFGLEYIPDRFTAYYREVAKFFFGEYDAEQFINALSTSMERLPK